MLQSNVPKVKESRNNPAADMGGKKTHQIGVKTSDLA
jgi:hypothetical protein